MRIDYSVPATEVELGDTISFDYKDDDEVLSEIMTVTVVSEGQINEGEWEVTLIGYSHMTGETVTHLVDASETIDIVGEL